MARSVQPVSSEFALAVECCRWTFAGGDPLPVERRARLVDWDRFLRVSRRHRVEGLVWHCLSRLAVPLPAQSEHALAADAAAVAQHNLRAARQSALLLEGFSNAGIPLLFVKGLSLGQLAYGDPFLKTGRDLDVLVPGDAIAAAAAELERLDHQLITPAVQPRSRQLARWHRTRKESVWRSPDGVHIELHSRLADSLDLIPGIGVDSPSQEVQIAPGIALPTLAHDELFAYLCVHGASSAWFRLKWITDLAALLSGCSEVQVGRLYQRSQELGAGRSAAQALLLASRTYGTRIDRRLRSRLEASRVNRWLASSAAAVMTRDREPTEARFGTTIIHLTQFFLRPGLGFKLEELSRQVLDAASNRI